MFASSDDLGSLRSNFDRYISHLSWMEPSGIDSGFMEGGRSPVLERNSLNEISKFQELLESMYLILNNFLSDIPPPYSLKNPKIRLILEVFKHAVMPVEKKFIDIIYKHFLSGEIQNNNVLYVFEHTFSTGHYPIELTKFYFASLYRLSLTKTGAELLKELKNFIENKRIRLTLDSTMNGYSVCGYPKFNPVTGYISKSRSEWRINVVNEKFQYYPWLYIGTMVAIAPLFMEIAFQLIEIIPLLVNQPNNLSAINLTKNNIMQENNLIERIENIKRVITSSELMEAFV